MYRLEQLRIPRDRQIAQSFLSLQSSKSHVVILRDLLSVSVVAAFHVSPTSINVRCPAGEANAILDLLRHGLDPEQL